MLKSFYYAFNGLFYAIKKERNMRIHLVIAALFILFVLKTEVYEILHLILFTTLIGLVLICEMINTALWAETNYVGVSVGKLDQSCEVYSRNDSNGAGFGVFEKIT